MELTSKIGTRVVRSFTCSTVLAAMLMFAISVTQTAGAQDISAKLVIHPPHSNPSSYTVKGPAGMTVEKLMQLTGTKYTVTFVPSVGGYATMQIGAIPKRTTGTLAKPFWWLCINDVSAKLGMSTQTVNDGDEIGWYFVRTGKCPKDGG